MTWRHAVAAVAGLGVGLGAALLLRRYRSFAPGKSGDVTEVDQELAGIGLAHVRDSVSTVAALVRL